MYRYQTIEDFDPLPLKKKKREIKNILKEIKNITENLGRNQIVEELDLLGFLGAWT